MTNKIYTRSSNLVMASNSSLWSWANEITARCIDSVFDFVGEQNFVDIFYLQWVAWMIYPIILTFLLPAVIVVFLYISVLILQLYRLRSHFFEAYRMDFSNAARQVIAALWDAHGKIWHGYEIHGFENIPRDGGAVIVYYHGALPVDFYYLMSRVILKKKRLIRAVGDRFLFKIPGFKLLTDAFGVFPGSISTCVDIVKQGHLLSISPGGVREAYFSDENYKLIWGQRVGFAKIAVEAKVPIIPMFTQNCREAFRSLGFAKGWLQKLYEKTRLPLVPIYGGFPVKLRTFIGDPIMYDPMVNAEQLAAKVQRSIEELISCHQRIPGNILCSLAERFYTPGHCQ